MILFWDRTRLAVWETAHTFISAFDYTWHYGNGQIAQFGDGQEIT